MGERQVKRRLPPYVTGWVDRETGRTYHYFRQRGRKKVPLPGLPWSEEFMRAYAAAKDGAPLIEVGAGKTRPGSLSAAIVAYYNSPGFRELKTSTQSVYRNIAERLRAEHADKSIATITKADVKRLLANRGGRSNTAYNFLKVLRGIMAAAIAVNMREDDPTEGLRARPKDTDGFHTWTREEVEQFKKRWPRGTRARLALALLLYTGQRRSDVVRMGRQHERMIEGEEYLDVKQDKGGKRLTLPILPVLREELDAGPRDSLAYLVTKDEVAFTPAGFGNWFRECCNKAGLPQCSAHGLRKAGATFAAENGATEKQLMAIFGWSSMKQAAHYTKAADQIRLATDAMSFIVGEKQQQKVPKPPRRFGNRGKK